MKLNTVKSVSVYYKPGQDKILVGRLVFKNRQLFFEYDSNFIERGLNLSPFKLPLQSGVLVSKDPEFEGLFGVFNDSLPDGWGRLLLDRYLVKHNLNPRELSVLDRLCIVGSSGMGALVYEPEAKVNLKDVEMSLDEIAAEVEIFQEDDAEDGFVEDLLSLGGSSGGARPKVLLDRDDGVWLIKFPATGDPKDIGAIEYAYHLMAKASGLELPKAKLFPAREGLGFFGTKCFDREEGKRIHMHTISGLLHADHRMPSLDYEMIFKAAGKLVGDLKEIKKLYRQCVFNVLSHNRDDHSKNFSFLMDESGHWRLSPAYDLVFSSGPGGEHCTMLMGEGRSPGKEQLLKLAKLNNIPEVEALDIIERVKTAVLQWSDFASEAGVSKRSAQKIESEIQKIIQACF